MTEARNPVEALVLTVPQAAKLLQVSENHLYSLISQNLVPHVRFGKLIRIPHWGLLQYIAASSGVPLPVEVAFMPKESVDGQQPEAED
jgi:excisionase family DNA binding protein